MSEWNIINFEDSVCRRGYGYWIDQDEMKMQMHLISGDIQLVCEGGTLRLNVYQFPNYRIISNYGKAILQRDCWWVKSEQDGGRSCTPTRKSRTEMSHYQKDLAISAHSKRVSHIALGCLIFLGPLIIVVWGLQVILHIHTFDILSCVSCLQTWEWARHLAI
jgi:hypothetical protein